MVRQNGLVLKWGCALLLLLTTLSLAVCGAPPDVETAKVSNFDVFEADLRDVFRSLAEFGGINILMDKAVQGTVTTRFQAGMTVKQAIEILAQTNGFSFRWLMPQRTVLIGSEASFKNIDVTQTKIYSLKYAEPETVMETLKVIVPKEQIGLDTRTNQLVVKANILEQQNVQEVITRLDREMPQLSIEVRIEEVSRKALDEMGVLWDLDKAFSLDFKTPKITYNPGQTLKLWEEKTKAKMLSKPTVATTDSKEAVIFIGDKLPISKTTKDSSGNPTTSVEFIEVGTKLNVTPRINNDNIVTVNVKATLSNVVGGQTIDGNDVPIVRNRETGSVIRLRDGETFMLSGLNQSESTSTEAGIKGLKKLPLLGYLFKTKTTKDPFNDTEIVIFVTPKILKVERNLNSEKVENPESKAVATPKAENVTRVEKTPELAVQSTTNSSIPVAVQPTNQQAVVQARATLSEPVQVVPAMAKDKPVELQPTSLQVAAVSDNPTEPADPVLAQTATAAPHSSSKVAAAAQTIPEKNSNIYRCKVKVQSKDTVAGLAKRYGISQKTILTENALPTQSSLKAGQIVTLAIPGDHLYELKPKETLWRVAKRYGVAIETLKSINNLADVTQVESGQTMILPVSSLNIVDKRF